MRRDWPQWLLRVRQVWDALPTREAIMVASAAVVLALSWRLQRIEYAFGVFVIAGLFYLGSQGDLTLPGGISFRFAGGRPEDQNGGAP